MGVLQAVAGAVLVTLSSGAGTKDVDCEALRSTSVPFQITYATWPIVSGGQFTPAVVEQQHRGEDGVGRRLRRQAGQMQVATIETRQNFAISLRTAAGEITFEIEGIALDRDHFSVARDFGYRRRIRYSDGRQFSDDNRARFRGEEAMTVSGCAFRVLVWDVERRNLEPRPGEPAESVETFWYAPDLRGFLRFRVVAGGTVQDRIAATIDTRFEPFE